nr:MAG TPA: hypothetical protein [Crassvirales sp.]
MRNIKLLRHELERNIHPHSYYQQSFLLPFL